ncbi:hypothetical protein QAD02_001366 [Eretmocerus hayati]|uniref:Uncharacterized protein n=1 Tax=Eretmocerus hayati TaxID=131215 RepID=A0ACC2NIN7_9HYME|nr:hypothetical protein QAD02_001366 [Eretmocerus hayati]
MYRYGLLLVLLNVGHDASAGSSKGIDRLLELGRDFLSAGRYQDALNYFHEAVEADPKHYRAYHLRGTVYLALGKAKQALQDFDMVLMLKPDFNAARIQRGTVYLKHGDLDFAELDFTNALSAQPGSEEATNSLQKIMMVRDQWHAAEEFYNHGDYRMAESMLNDAIETCSWTPELRKLRAKCRMELGDYAGAVSDIRSTTKLLSDNTEGYYELSSLLYQLGQVQDSLKEIRECLKLDPEHKDCFPLYKKIKKIAKFIEDAEAASESNDLETCIDKSNRVLKQETKIQNVRFTALRLLCKCHTANSAADLAIKNCRAAVEIQRDPETLCDSAEAYLAGEMFDDAIRDYKEALDIDGNHQRAKQGLQTAQQRQKQSESRDYYKILGVPRTAKKQQIVKAYRKAAQKWHPDNFPDPEEKKRAEKKFIDIAAAKEVLTDEEKRAMFDRGQDPLDPESGKHGGQGFNPFQEFHHFHQQGGSPFQFKFHFN